MTVEIRTIRSDIPGHANRPHRLPSAPGAHPLQDQQALQTRRLLVGRGITLSGQVSDCENLIVEGKVVADGMTVGQLDVLESGTCTGTLQAENAIIAGRFEGRMVVTGTLKLKPTALVVGEVFYAAMTMEDGATIDARLQKQAAGETDLPPNVEKLFDDGKESRAKAGGQA